ncbi:MAG: hypothetical protein HYX67_01915, partial [Candidatus Melainabacteria bacterium]|nr:hypothetical protein [Candidatus Melainabacteria bacterium]
MRIRHAQSAAASLGVLITFSLNANAAQPNKVQTLIEQVKIFTPPTETETAAKEILKVDPASGDAQAMLVWNLYRAHKLDSAIELDKKAITLKFRDLFWKRRAFNILYHCYIDKKDWAQALKYCLLCYKVEPSSGVAHDLSILYDKTGNAKLAKEYALTSEQISSD